MLIDRHVRKGEPITIIIIIIVLILVVGGIKNGCDNARKKQAQEAAARAAVEAQQAEVERIRVVELAKKEIADEKVLAPKWYMSKCDVSSTGWIISGYMNRMLIFGLIFYAIGATVFTIIMYRRGEIEEGKDAAVSVIGFYAASFIIPLLLSFIVNLFVRMMSFVFSGQWNYAPWHFLHFLSHFLFMVSMTVAFVLFGVTRRPAALSKKNAQEEVDEDFEDQDCEERENDENPKKQKITFYDCVRYVVKFIGSGLLAYLGHKIGGWLGAIILGCIGSLFFYVSERLGWFGWSENNSQSSHEDSSYSE